MKTRRKKRFSTSIDKNSELKWGMLYIYMLTFSNFKTWLNMASSLHAVAVVHRARERKKGTYTLDRQYQIIVVCERKRGWNKIKFFFFFSLIKNTTFCWKRWRGLSGSACVHFFF
jgi:hypothetical protein